MPSFNNKDLIGVEIFDNADAALTSALDVSPIAAQMQAKVRAVAGQAVGTAVAIALQNDVRRAADLVQAPLIGLIQQTLLKDGAFIIARVPKEGSNDPEKCKLVRIDSQTQQAGDLHLSGPKYFWMADQYPAEQVSLRNASPEKVLLQVEETMICHSK